MSSNFAKWGINSNDDRPVNIVLFKSRNKDNKDLEGYHERQMSFITKEPMDSEKLQREFRVFVKNGLPGETSRMYYSVNDRDEQKIRQALLHLLIDQPNLNLCDLPSRLASIAAARECAATKRWLFDFDLDDQNAVREFCADILNLARIDGHSISVSTHKTPHGYAVITDRGFDTRDLFAKWFNDDVTLMRDNMLCASWETNAEPVLERDIPVEEDEPFI